MKIRKYQKRPARPFNFSKFLLGCLLVGLAFFSTIFLLTRGETDEANAGPDPTIVSQEKFIETLVPHAQELQEAYGVLPSIIIGQAILESNWGQSQLASEYNNLFGIKAYGDGPSVHMETEEYVNETWITINGEFRAYSSWEESMDDHTQLFVNGVSWNQQLYHQVLLAQGYREAANALQEAGYATDPDYAAKIINMIENYDLDQYDQ